MQNNVNVILNGLNTVRWSKGTVYHSANVAAGLVGQLAERLQIQHVNSGVGERFTVQKLEEGRK